MKDKLSKEVYTQDEMIQTLRAGLTPILLGSGNFIYHGDQTIVAGEKVKLIVGGSALVYAWDSAFVQAYEFCTVDASGNTFVSASDEVEVCSHGNALVFAHESAKVVAKGSGEVFADGDVMVNASDNVKVEARDQATLYLFGEASAMAFDAVTVTGRDKNKIILQDVATFKKLGVSDTVDGEGDEQ